MSKKELIKALIESFAMAEKERKEHLNRLEMLLGAEKGKK